MKFKRNKSAPIPDYSSETHRIWKSAGAWKIRRFNSDETVDAERANFQEAKLYCERDLANENFSEHPEPTPTPEPVAPHAKKPATEKTLALREKLRALVLRGVNGERHAAEEKLKRLEARYDFTAPILTTQDIFAGHFYPSSVAEPILAFCADDFDVANSIKAAVEAETGVRCVWRDGVLLACALPQSAKQLEVIAKNVAGSFVALWQQFRQAGANPSDRGNFIAGLADGMLDDVRVNQPLPTRPSELKVRKAKKRALGHAPGLNLHPYSIATGLGKSIRFSVSLDEIAGQLDNAIRGELA